ncbi:glycine--tRNA ligase subunit beta [Turneriella parva]|uniref:Glycine--tRNA ligase beta subunit n=1 Tax=Turneriella parva (strain ATCC BAA-1111 / DSM 21527 / NCTC 11395 / H) TaxID=869212 RepID=I4B6B8_TURPD|nr:glycine--tRNA ligase subunit beta [Turneriella parva]AFM12825.1 glycyl-tRNA synthetase beta chain [Turneriella parva DSM 21527]
MAETLLFELATEEIPAAYQKNALADWQKRLPALIKATGLAHGTIHVFATARRIAFTVSAIADKGEDTTETLQGPAKSAALDAAGKPTPALVGFAKKAGIAPEAVSFIESPKGSYATATVTRPGKALRSALPGIIQELAGGVKFARSMRWSDLANIYARPIAGYFALYGQNEWKFEPAELQNTLLADIPFRPVRGHFILDPKPVGVPSAEAYAAALASHQIIADAAERKAQIGKLLRAAAAGEKLELIENEALLDEVNFIVERPGVVVGTFAPDFLRLPDGVILSEMNQHQRYFGMRDASGRLSNRFLIVANAMTADAAAVKNIREGNERVLRARLADGAFFYDEDLKRPLGERVDDLKQIVFHEGLGTYREKVDRMAEFASLIAGDKVPRDLLQQASRLAKADLTTALVYEFDHLQGEIGSVYAAHAGVAPQIVTAIHEHYLPRFQGDSLPQSELGALISLADKWDNALAAFVLGKEPTASQDPFAVRRQTLYIIQILVAQKIRLSLVAFIAAALKKYPAGAGDAGASLADKVLQFFKGRLATIFESEGFDKKLTRAAVFSGGDDAYDLFARASALKVIAEKDRTSFDALLAAFKRMANISKEADAKAKVEPAKFATEQEKQLYAFAEGLHKRSAVAADDLLRHYKEIFAEFAAGKPTVDDFFTHVMVNHEDAAIRTNRLALVTHTIAAVRNLLDLEQLA